MDLKPIFEAAKRFASSNTTGILTGIGAGGAVVTAVLTAKASFSAAYIITDQEAVNIKDLGDDARMLTTSECVKLVWKEFVPPAIVGAMTVTAIIAAHSVGSRKQAALVAAFKLSDELRTEYREKVVKTLGAEKEDKMNAELVRERIERIPNNQVIMINGSDILFFDAFSGRVFSGDMENIKRAVNEINYRVNNYGWASLSDFYQEIGVEKTEVSDEFGWKQDELLDPMFTYVGLKDGKPACQIDFNTATIRSFNRQH